MHFYAHIYTVLFKCLCLIRHYKRQPFWGPRQLRFTRRAKSFMSCFLSFMLSLNFNLTPLNHPFFIFPFALFDTAAMTAQKHWAVGLWECGAVICTWRPWDPLLFYLPHDHTMHQDHEVYWLLSDDNIHNSSSCLSCYDSCRVCSKWLRNCTLPFQTPEVLSSTGSTCYRY